ncbi:MAG: helix-turn-helix domain-containing protein [Gammaproteobacteria bacterium]
MTLTPQLIQEATISEQVATLDGISCIGPGAQLRTAREARRLSVEDVANRLHLTRTMILEIESDKYDRRLAFTFVRGYLRAYARLVRVSPEAVVSAFEQLGLKEFRSEINSKVPVTTWRVQENHVRWASYGIIIVLLAVVVGLAAWWFYQPSEQDNAPQDLIKLLNNVSSPEKRLQVPTTPPVTQENNLAPQALAPETNHSGMMTEGTLIPTPGNAPIAPNTVAPSTPALNSAPSSIQGSSTSRALSPGAVSTINNRE